MFHFEKILWILVSLLLASCAQTSPRQERQPAKASAERFHQVALIQCKGCPQQPISFTQQSLDHSRVHFASALIRTPHDLVEHHARLKKKTSVFSSPVNFHKVVEYATASSLWVSMGFRFGYPPGGGKKYKKSANYRVLLAFPHSEEAFVAHIIVCLRGPCGDAEGRRFGDLEVVSVYGICGEGVNLVDSKTRALKKLAEGKDPAQHRLCKESDLKRFPTAE